MPVGWFWRLPGGHSYCSMHQRVYSPAQDMQCASCECLHALLELSLGLVCGTCGVNPRVLAVAAAVTH